MARDREVVVLGGGPAGAAAALLLARWGHAVQLITRPAAERGLAVSLPPSCAKLFEAIGISDAIGRAGFARSNGNTVWWGGATARVEPFAENARGWLLDVGALSELILDLAVAAGAGVERRVLEPDTDQAADSAFVLDCTGRSGVMARRLAMRVSDDGRKTIALCGSWHRDGGWPVPDDTHTLVESYEDGWIWSVPIAPGVRHVAAMVDPQRSDLARGRTPLDVYRSEIAKTREFRALVSSSALVGGPRGFDASPYRSRAYAGERWLLVGDAGSFIDPLSSAGVKKALASAWLAAIAVHTALRSSSMRAHAFEFYSAREDEIERHLSRDSRRFLADAAAGHHHKFWDERSDEEDGTTAESGGILEAFERLKSGESWRLRVGPAIQIQPRPCVRGHEITLEPHVVSTAHPQGIRYVNGIDVIAVIELAPSSRQVPDLFESYVRRVGAAPLPDFLVALATAVARGWLVSE